MSDAATAPSGAPIATRAVRSAVAQAAAAHDAEDAADALWPLFEKTDWLRELADDAIAPLHDDPLAALPFRASRNGASASLILAATPRVTLMVTRIGGRAERPETAEQSSGSMIFSGGLSLLRLLGGDAAPARLGHAKMDSPLCRTRDVRLRPEHPIRLDERHRALWIAPPERALFLLRARILPDPAPLARRFSLQTGALLGRVQSDEAFARTAMLLSVLRAADARQAVPDIVELLGAVHGRDRWTVMRELLALDAGAAWPHLRVMADADPEPAIRAAARETLERHGAHKSGPREPCHA